MTDTYSHSSAYARSYGSNNVTFAETLEEMAPRASRLSGVDDLWERVEIVKTVLAHLFETLSQAQRDEVMKKLGYDRDTIGIRIDRLRNNTRSRTLQSTAPCWTTTRKVNVPISVERL